MYALAIRHYIWLLCVTYVVSKCVYRSFDYDSPPLFTTSVDHKEMIIEWQTSTMTIGEGHEINAYCLFNFSSPGSFHNPIFNLNHITIRCYNDRIFYVTYNNTELRNLENLPPLSCAQTIHRYQAETSFCEKKSIVYGLEAGQNSKYLSDVCYDFDTMETLVVHYDTGSAGTILHPEFYIYRNRKLSIDVLESMPERTKKLNQLIHLTWPEKLKSHVYRFDELIPSLNLLRGRRVNSMLTEINSIPWWTNLKDGNWKLVEEITEGFTATRYFDIYTGILHYNESDFKLRREPLKYLHHSLNSIRLRIPLFVWKYLKPKHPYDAIDEIIIIGINYPFLTHDQVHSLIFCRDVCHQFNWLRDLSARKQFVGFGFVFCCNANEAREKILVIHKIQLAFKNLFEPLMP